MSSSLPRTLKSRFLALTTLRRLLAGPTVPTKGPRTQVKAIRYLLGRFRPNSCQISHSPTKLHLTTRRQINWKGQVWKELSELFRITTISRAASKLDSRVFLSKAAPMPINWQLKSKLHLPNSRSKN